VGIQDIIAADITNIFTVASNTPISVQAVYTPVGGVAQAAVTLLYSNSPLHGDENQDYDVEQADIVALGKASSVSSWTLRGTVIINSTNYQLINNPFPQDAFWSVLMLRLPHGQETRI
jgi:hypothetical protein